MSELTPKDRKILQAALVSGHAFEKNFNGEKESSFRASLLACAGADSFLVQKLAELAPKVSISYGPRHLMTLLVPLERLMGRSARDEEFLYFEQDGARKSALGDGSNASAIITSDASRANTDGPVAVTSRRIVLCENIRSAFNVGSVYRTAETFSGNEVWLTGYSPDPQKTAMGADTLVQTQRFERTSDAIVEARKLGYKVVALENSPGAVPLEKFFWPENTILVLGNERFGVDSQTLDLCDSVVRISTSGQKNSLNVGTAFGIAAASWRNGGQDAASVAPIGFLRGGFKDSQVAPRQGAYTSALGAKSPAYIELESRFQGRPSNFEQALTDLDGFDRAWIVFGFDRSPGWNPQVRPPRGDGAKRGLFATRSPHRPNGLGLSCVKIESVSGRRVEISEHDLLEGTPIYDIKPYIPGADAFPEAKAGWVDKVSESQYELIEGTGFAEKLRWLEEHGESRLQDFISEQLTFQPFDRDRKRVELASNGRETNSIAFRTWRIEFIEKSERVLELLNLRSGYSEADLLDETDNYGDKQLHRDFRKAFHD